MQISKSGEDSPPQGPSRGTAGGIATFISDIQIYHNYVRPHELLDGKTPTEACGIVIIGENKWIALIQNTATAAK
jgi:hypothetical protein